MSDGLITRIGRWIDLRWESKATESMVIERFLGVENAQSRDKAEILEKINAMAMLVRELDAAIKDPSEAVKELSDLKTRIEKIELYSGMTRKVDPTKPPVVKSAFSM